MSKNAAFFLKKNEKNLLDLTKWRRRDFLCVFKVIRNTSIVL